MYGKCMDGAHHVDCYLQVLLSDSSSYRPQEVQCDTTTAAKVKIINHRTLVVLL